MRRTNVVGVSLSVIVCALLLPGVASGQQATASGIAGVVKDTSGAVLPGVTVEAASPALIEKVRTVVTDSEGRYNIVDLRPGTYVVTFTLTGFNTFRRDGIELTVRVHGDGERRHAGRRSQRDDHGDGRVAAGRHAERPQADRGLERSAQRAAEQCEEPEQSRGADAGVSRQRRVRHHRRLQRPNRRHATTARAARTSSSTAWASSTRMGNQGYNANAETVQELVLSISGISADSNADGAIVNMIPKEGGNSFTRQRLRALRQRRACRATT